MSLLSVFSCRGEMSDVIDPREEGIWREVDMEEVIVAVEKPIPSLPAPRVAEYKDILKELALEEEPIFVNGNPDTICPLRHMSRQDRRLRNKYELSRERMADSLNNMRHVTQLLFESRNVTRDAKRGDCLNIAQSVCSTNDKDLQGVYSLYEKEFHREFDLDRHDQQLENRYKWSKSYVKQCRKDQLKIISHFKERKFIQLSALTDFKIRYEQSESAIDLELLEKNLPPEIVDIIGSYLTYYTRIHNLEETVLFYPKIRYMTPKTSQYYLEYLMRFPEYYVVTEDEFVCDQMYKEVFNNNNRARTSMEERKRRILYIYYKFRLYNEPVAHRMLKEFAILFS